MCAQNPTHADKESSSHAAGNTEPPAERAHEPEEKKRTKSTRVQKREKELYGLVTPVFLPLLDARDLRDTAPKHAKKEPKPQPQPTEAAPPAADTAHATPARHAGSAATENSTARREDTDMEDSGAGGPSNESPKKTKRSTTKKSALRQVTNPRSRRKRVSLVIDGQTVLPADTVAEPALTSPSSEATSASNSTASLDDLIDPRLTTDDPVIHTEHYDAVHHSLPLHMSNHTHSPTKPLIDPPSSLPTDTAPYAFNPPSTAIHSFLDPSPTHPASLPKNAGPDPIFADSELVADPVEAGDGAFDTYVGGLHGSGTDDVDQAGSYGYPSSLGASYLESYMQSRPLRVRMEAADKAGLDEREKGVMVAGKGEDRQTTEESVEIDEGKRRSKDGDGDEDMDIMGEMEGF
jgi:hypothetical protein